MPNPHPGKVQELAEQSHCSVSDLPVELELFLSLGRQKCMPACVVALLKDTLFKEAFEFFT
jgi:hypothetical protein